MIKLPRLSGAIKLQLVALLFSVTPLTRCYRVRARLLKSAGIDCDLSIRVVSSVRIVISNVSIGKDTFIGHQVLITGAGDANISIGNYVDIAPRVVIVSGTHDIDMSGKRAAGVGKGARIAIEDGVWIGANTTVLPGVRIGAHAVIGAGSVVVRDIPSFCVAVGNPCRPIKFWDGESASFNRGAAMAFELAGED